MPDDVESAVFEFLKENPYPNDSDVHEFAEDIGFAVEDVEVAIYALATKFVEFMNEGRSTEAKLIVEDVDPEQLEIGTDIEMEHTNDPTIAEKIALDHIAEFPNYYVALVEMEKDLEESE